MPRRWMAPRPTPRKMASCSAGVRVVEESLHRRGVLGWNWTPRAAIMSISWREAASG